ncbi:class I adenylate-forming enzyme family protein [Pseudonocardia sp. GCM10023141]|uniref:class I adenylate-forming enzyme family protein n=1 Tax=Pseudonocardia sp. GCM10023141 TaxID=3252653 RepID=UPI00362345C9
MSDLIITDWVAQHARQRPDAIALALHETGATVTWAELERRVAALAGVLRDTWGARPGDRVALVAENDPRLLEVQFACMRIGAVFMPLNWRLTATELGAQLADAEPVAMIHDADWRALVDELALAVPRACWDEPSYDALLAAADPVAGGDLDPDAVTHLLYTSGTTGLPKGVLCTNRTLVTHAQNLAHTSRMAERDQHHLNVVPWFHAGGLNVFTNAMLFWGGRVTTVRRYDPAVALGLLTDPGLAITHLCGVLQTFEWLVRQDGFAAVAAFPALHTALFGGWGPSTQEIVLALRARGVPVQLSWGASELGPLVTVLSRPDDAAADAGSSGTVVPHTRLRIVAPDGTDVEPGGVGELWVRGGAVTPGYWRQPRDDTFHGLWFRTGDAGRMDAAGHVYIVGRVKEMYRSGGENVYPAEVENVLADLPGVAELTVVGVPDERWGETGLLAVVLEPGAALTLADVQAFAAGRLARFKQPSHLLVLDVLPRSATAKISRAAIREAFLGAGVPA